MPNTAFDATRHFRSRRVQQTLWLELVHPPVNFLTVDILAELYDIIQAANRDDSLRVVVLTGGIENRYIFHFSIPEIQQAARNAGELKLTRIARSALLAPLLRVLLALTIAGMRRFTAFERFVLGLTRKFRRSMPTNYLLLQMHATYNAIETCRKITIAAMNGNCNGGGTEMAACFDFRFMVGDRDFVIGQPEVMIGIVPGGGGTQRVSRLIGRARALELMLTCDMWSAQQAKAAGLITDHFPAAAFVESVQAFADRMSTRSAVAAVETRRAVHEGMDRGLSGGLAEEAIATLRCLGSPATEAALAEYTEILRESIDARPDDPAPATEVFETVNSPRVTRYFTGPGGAR